MRGLETGWKVETRLHAKYKDYSNPKHAPDLSLFTDVSETDFHSPYTNLVRDVPKVMQLLCRLSSF